MAKIIHNKQHNNAARKNNFAKIFFFLSIFVSSVSGLFALDEADILQQIDSSFQRQSESQLEEILQSSISFNYYGEIEAYVLKKIRESLIYNRLQYARFAALTLMDNNLDNFDALDLYTRISKTISTREEISAKEEESRLAKLAEEQRIAEEVRAEVREKLEKDFSQVVTTEGQNVYFADSSQTRYTAFDWSASFAFVGFEFLSTPTITSVKYGIGASANLFHHGDTIAIGGEASILSYMLTFAGAENFITDFKIAPAISFLDLNPNLFFRFGFRGILTDPTQDGTAVSKFLSPIVGLEWKNIAIGITQSDVYVDYLFGHLAVPEIKVAMDVGIKTVIPVSNQGSFSIGVLVGLSDTLIITNAGLENHAKFTISIGVGNYE